MTETGMQASRYLNNVPRGKYKVDDVTQEEREDCYLATLHIRDTTSTDSRAYYLAVENDKGTDRHAVQLYVNGKLRKVC
ncbi:unnamed protein product [Acanthoscelides obtectus]|uniref:Uncharacterized protein n=1 Tax=Acanthoscelides obtectus TaxID=200917 RepID=A0A9P0L201_ACAOB|nr:unnamed protein product [Acanthoscelides obtectus]CAK1652278.1 hypothetical protein AOBTE_LOCUS17763 [Acanthoscelides obtectus]